MGTREGVGDTEVDPLAVASPLQNTQIVGKEYSTPSFFPSLKDNTNEGKDEPSRKGRFGWCEVAGVFLPVIHRSCNERYFSIRMVEKILLNKLLPMLPVEVFTCSVMYSFKVTEAEFKLLSEINALHCDSKFGRERFNAEDLLVEKEDMIEFYKFLELCHRKMIVKKSTEKDRCGFIRIGGTSDVPYTQVEGVKFLPSFYFEGELDRTKCVSLSGWDWAYLRFCCKVQGVKDELITGDVCEAVALQELRLYFAPGTSFVEYWPSKDFISKVVSKKMSRPGSWAKIILNHVGNKFNGKLVPIKNFPLQQFSRELPYKPQKCLIGDKVIECMNIRPYQYKEVMMTLPHMVEKLFPGFTEEQVGNMLLSQDVRIYKANHGQSEVIKQFGWEDKYDSVPLVTVKDILPNIQSWKKSKVVSNENSKRSKGI